MNETLGNQIIEIINQKPKQLNMNWFSNYNVYTEKWTFCIAGWAIVLEHFDGDEDRAGEWLEIADTQNIVEFAGNLLQCSDDLFFVSQWPEHLQPQSFLSYTSEQYAELAIKAINYYMALEKLQKLVNKPHVLNNYCVSHMRLHPFLFQS